MSHILCKVYGAFCPAEEACRASVEAAGTGALGNEPWLFLEGDLLRISFEGMYFPQEDVINALTACLPHEAEGKLDYLDLEAWSLKRYVFSKSGFQLFTRSLNHVMDYSGH